MINAPSGGAPKKAPRWDILVQKVAAVEIGFRGAPGCFQGMSIYIGGRSRLVEQRGAHEGGERTQGGRRAPCLVASLIVS